MLQSSNHKSVTQYSIQLKNICMLQHKYNNEKQVNTIAYRVQNAAPQLIKTNKPPTKLNNTNHVFGVC